MLLIRNINFIKIHKLIDAVNNTIKPVVEVTIEKGRAAIGTYE